MTGGAGSPPAASDVEKHGAAETMTDGRVKSWWRRAAGSPRGGDRRRRIPRRREHRAGAGLRPSRRRLNPHRRRSRPSTRGSPIWRVELALQRVSKKAIACARDRALLPTDEHLL